MIKDPTLQARWPKPRNRWVFARPVCGSGALEHTPYALKAPLRQEGGLFYG